MNFMDVVSERFFAVNVFASPHGFHGNDRVGVIGRANNHAVDFFPHFVEHHPVILELLGFGVFLKSFGGVLRIHVTKRDDVCPFIRDLVRIPAALASNPDSSHVNLVIGRDGPSSHQSSRRYVKQSGDSAGASKELSSCKIGESTVKHRWLVLMRDFEEERKSALKWR